MQVNIKHLVDDVQCYQTVREGYPLKAGHPYTPMFQASKAAAASDGHAVHC